VTDEPIGFLINASPHGDHVNSNEVFAGAAIISHEGAYEAIAEVRSRVQSAGSGILPPLPHQTYRDRMTLVVGGRTIELHYYGRGHTRGDTVVFLPESGVAFLSELYFNGVFASVGEGFVREHIETLSQAMELPAEWWIPGHGYIVGQTRAQLAQGMEDYLANLEAIHAAVSLRVARGQTLEEVLAGIDADLGDFANLPFYLYLKNSAISGTYRALTETP
jgi:cyclase